MGIILKNENIKNNVTDLGLAEIRTDEEFESFEDEDDGLVYGLRFDQIFVPYCIFFS